MKLCAMAVTRTDKVFRERLPNTTRTRSRARSGGTSPHAAAALLISSLAIPSLAACQVVANYQSFTGGDGAPPHRCDVLPASKLDEKKLVTLELSKVPGAPPSEPCYWIDETEVTVEQYRRFISEHAPIDWDPGRCAGRKTAPSDPEHELTDSCSASTAAEDTPFADRKPIRCVDWCDAKAFCHWAGKDLCGGNANGGTVTGDVAPQWEQACSKNGWSYVYGPTPVDGACNVGLDTTMCISALNQNHCAPTYVGSFPRCTSPSGAVDMIGNVAEWVLSCHDQVSPSSSLDGSFVDAGHNTECQYRGGSFDDSRDAATCYTLIQYAKTATHDRHIGFRCCADLSDEEKNLVK